MSVARLPRRVTIESLVDLARELVRRDGLTPMAAAGLCPVDDLDGDERRTLLVTGLARLVNDAKWSPTGAAEFSVDSDPSPGGPRSGRFQTPIPPEARASAFYALYIPFEAVDGTMRPLIDFEPADWQYYITRSVALTKAWKARTRFGKTVAKELTRHNATTIRRLPQDTQERLAVLAAEVHGGPGR